MRRLKRNLKTLHFLAILALTMLAPGAMYGQVRTAGGAIISEAGQTGYYLRALSPLVFMSQFGALDCSGEADCDGFFNLKTGSTNGLDPLLIDNVDGQPTLLAPGGDLTVTGAGGTGPHGEIFSGTLQPFPLWNYTGTCTGTNSCGVSGGYYRWELVATVFGTVYIHGQIFTGVYANFTLTTTKTKIDPFSEGTGAIGISSIEMER